MHIVGFTIARNARKYDYPVTESIRSILPVCDEFIVSVGNSDDDTEDMIRAIGSDKIKIVHSTWDDTLRTGGRVLAVETDKAFDAVPAHADWAFYLQADEVVHEKHLDAIRQAAAAYQDDPRVEGLLFGYQHFYGHYRYVGASRKWYRREIRMIRNNKRIRSYRDAQGFRLDGRKLNVKLIEAEVYHYGWVKNPVDMNRKQANFGLLWAGAAAPEKIETVGAFDYEEIIDKLQLFKGTHPAVMQDRISRADWTFDWDIRRNRMKWKYRLLHWIENLTGKRLFEYRNYRII